MLYVVLGHRIAQGDKSAGIDRLGMAMLIAVLVISPLGLKAAIPAFLQLNFMLAGIGVGICSSVIPYIFDQFAMARLTRASFALFLSLLPAMGTVIGIIVLSQIPTMLEVIGILLVGVGVALHQEKASPIRNVKARANTVNPN
jgi:inner membrane transporter RhtA